MQRDRLFALAKWLVLILNVLNVVVAVLLTAVLALSFAVEAPLMARLVAKYGADAGGVLAAVRAMALLGMLCSVPVYVILTALRRMLRSAEEGDPFVPENARRLHAIGWALLAVQFVDIAVGVLGAVAPAREGAPDWEPSLTGWIAVVMVFVLARVFVQGTRMREELAMTV